MRGVERRVLSDRFGVTEFRFIFPSGFVDEDSRFGSRFSLRNMLPRIVHVVLHVPPARDRMHDLAENHA